MQLRELRTLTFQMTIAKHRFVMIENERVGRIVTANRRREDVPIPARILDADLVDADKRTSILRLVYLSAHGQEKHPELYSLAETLTQYAHFTIWGPESLRKSAVPGPKADLSSNILFGLGGQGHGLPLLLKGIQSSPLANWKELIREFAKTYPQITDIRFRKGLERGEWGIEFVESGSNGHKLRIRPSHVSDGMLRLLALLAIRYAPESLKILAYEEPENGLHPTALDDCMRHLKAIARRGTQVILTTHSPHLLNHVLEDHERPRADLRLVWRRKDGTTAIEEPDPEKIDRARRHGFGLGELWGMLLDEKDLAKRRRAKA